MAIARSLNDRRIWFVTLRYVVIEAFGGARRRYKVYRSNNAFTFLKHAACRKMRHCSCSVQENASYVYQTRCLTSLKSAFLFHTS